VRDDDGDDDDDDNNNNNRRRRRNYKLAHFFIALHLDPMAFSYM